MWRNLFLELLFGQEGSALFSCLGIIGDFDDFLASKGEALFSAARNFTESVFRSLGKWHGYPNCL